MSALDLPVRVPNPRTLPAWQLPAERIPVGIPGDYKPSTALLPGGELLMVGLFQEQLSEGRIREWTPVWRSCDGGRTWSTPQDFGDRLDQPPRAIPRQVAPQQSLPPFDPAARSSPGGARRQRASSRGTAACAW